MTVVNSTVSGNGSSENNGGNLTISTSTVNDNLDNIDGTLNFASSTGSNVRSSTQNSTTATATIINGTFLVNALAGVLNYSGSTMTITSSTFLGGGVYVNTGNLTMKNTILAGAGVHGGHNCMAAFQSAGHNLSDDASCNFAGLGDVNNIPAGLDPNGLQNNGGPTQTIALKWNSPAVNAIPLAACTDANSNPLSTDQRGVARPQTPNCDIGAFELVTDIDSGGSGVVLNGNNTFTGNQTVNGTVSATNFAGNGSGLTNVAAAGLNCNGCVGNTQLSITYAGSSSKGGPATNALLLNGQPPSFYATTSANNFSGNQTVTGNIAASGSVTIGAGTPITEHLSILANPALAALKPLSCDSAQFPLAGAADGDTIALGVPNARMSGGSGVILSYSAWVSAPGTLTI
jgi:hypothetical protein